MLIISLIINNEPAAEADPRDLHISPQLTAQLADVRATELLLLPIGDVQNLIQFLRLAILQ